MRRAVPGLALVAFALLLTGCPPLGPLPGGPLTGEVVLDPVDDWSFTEKIELIQIETRPECAPMARLWSHSLSFSSSGVLR